ncbi:dehydrogenase [Paenibacillus glycanilyticus]|uniref:dehydrogenase n=1 Tax=Paenibacillus glycanilyticus TaxID=126569 RepID=UPI0020407789|nr:dehydrogenase [Paenibacillus glycanilyticus]MCM3629386.1 dehydrogenase [Paenibacillus glycanilyticus]
MKSTTQKHTSGLPSARKIRRACSNELYRTVKRLKVWVPKEKMDQAETLYYKKVIQNLLFIAENEKNRKVLSDWWDENVASEIAELWEVDVAKLRWAFRDAFGG